MLMRPSLVKSWPLRALRVGMHAVEHVDAPGHALDEVFGRAGAHQIARPIGGRRPAVAPTTAYISSIGSPTLSPPIA